MYKTISIAAVSALLLGGCTTYEPVTSTAVTAALDLEKTDRFAIFIADTSQTDTAFSSDMQTYAKSSLIDELEDNGFDYVGERQPQIRFTLRTHPAVAASYLDTKGPEEVSITTTEAVRQPDGSVTRTTETRTVETSRGSEPVYLPANTRIFLLDVYDTNTQTLLWRGHLTDDDTSLNEEKLDDAIEQLIERLENET